MWGLSQVPAKSDFWGRDTHWCRLIQGWTGPCSKTHGWVAHPQDTGRGSGGRHLRCFLTSQCALSALFFSGEALGAIGDPEVLEILKQYSTDPVVEVTQHPPMPTPILGPGTGFRPCVWLPG